MPPAFDIYLIKPTRYDDEGYPLQWWRSLISGLAILKSPPRHTYTDAALVSPSASPTSRTREARERRRRVAGAR